MSVDQFVVIVDKFPCIYNRDSPDYARNDATEEAWREIADEIEWTVTECKEKWQEILNDYSEYLKNDCSDRLSNNLYHQCKDLRFLLPHAPEPVDKNKQRAPCMDWVHWEEWDYYKDKGYKRSPTRLEEREAPSFLPHDPKPVDTNKQRAPCMDWVLREDWDYYGAKGYKRSPTRLEEREAPSFLPHDPKPVDTNKQRAPCMDWVLREDWDYYGAKGYKRSPTRLEEREAPSFLPQVPKTVDTNKERASCMDSVFCKERELLQNSTSSNSGYKRRIPSPLEEREAPSFKRCKIKETESFSSKDDTPALHETSADEKPGVSGTYHDGFQNDTRKMFLLSLLTDLEKMSDKKMALFRIEALMLLQDIQARYS